MRTWIIAVLILIAASFSVAQLLPPQRSKQHRRVEEEEEPISKVFKTQPRGNYQPRTSAAVTAFAPIKVNQDTTTEPQNECTVAVNPLNRDNMVVVFRDFRYGGGENGTTAIRNVGIATTLDGGASWHESLAAYLESNRFTDPDVVVDKNGQFFVVTLNSSAPPWGEFGDTTFFTVASSVDHGLGWSQGTPTDGDLDFHDKEMIDVDVSDVSPNLGNVYVAGDFLPGGFGQTQAYVFASAPVSSIEGANFAAPVTIPGFFPVPAAGVNGEMYVVYTSDTVGVVKSTDGGMTFGPAVNVSDSVLWSEILIDSGSVDLFSVGEPVICVDRTHSAHRGDVYVSWLTAKNGDADVFCARSTDGGATWLTPVRVNDDSLGNGKDQFHHSMTVDDSGYVDLVFLDRRNDPANLFCDAYFAQSRDGGKSFKNFRLTPQNFDPRLTPSYEARLGDYMGISAAQGRVVPVWVDTHLGNEDIFTAMLDQEKFAAVGGTVFGDCNANGVLDSTETGIPNVLVYLLHDAGFDTVRTDSNGHYVFAGLFAGSYNVAAGVPQSSLTGTGSYAVTLSAAQVSGNHNIGLKTISIPNAVLGWNLVSLPRAVDHGSAASVFSGLTSPVYAYNVGYQMAEMLSSGYGYWVEAGCGGAESLTGNSLTTVSVGINPGWNLVGGATVPVSTAAAQTNPTTVLGSFFGYTGAEGYTAADTIIPGQGYWLKSPIATTLTLSASATALQRVQAKPDLSRMSTLAIADEQGRSRTLYVGSTISDAELAKFELPPTPPLGTFDVRFASQRSAEFIGVGDASAHQLEIQTASPKVRLTWNVTGTASYVLSSGSFAKSLEGSGSMELSASQARGLAISGQGGNSTNVPKSFALEQNYPDPFNPVTTIHYQLPTASQVSITVYNTLGQVVSTLANGIESAGFKSVNWDGSNQPSGVYFYRLDATSVGDAAAAYHQVLKMVLIK